MLQTALQFLSDHNEIAFATCKGDFPKLRVFQIMKQEGTVLYFATSPEKQVYRELQDNPNVELLASADKVSVRCSGVVNFEVADDIQQCIIRKTKCSHVFKRSDLFPKTKRPRLRQIVLSKTLTKTPQRFNGL